MKITKRKSKCVKRCSRVEKLPFRINFPLLFTGFVQLNCLKFAHVKILKISMYESGLTVAKYQPKQKINMHIRKNAPVCTLLSCTHDHLVYICMKTVFSSIQWHLFSWKSSNFRFFSPMNSSDGYVCLVRWWYGEWFIFTFFSSSFLPSREWLLFSRAFQNMSFSLRFHLVMNSLCLCFSVCTIISHL